MNLNPSEQLPDYERMHNIRQSVEQRRAELQAKLDDNFGLALALIHYIDALRTVLECFYYRGIEVPSQGGEQMMFHHFKQLMNEIKKHPEYSHKIGIEIDSDRAVIQTAQGLEIVSLETIENYDLIFSTLDLQILFESLHLED